jgi:hypothetical protein
VIDDAQGSSLGGPDPAHFHEPEASLEGLDAYRGLSRHYVLRTVVAAHEHWDVAGIDDACTKLHFGDEPTCIRRIKEDLPIEVL